MQERAKQLADAHWGFVGGFAESLGVDPETLKTLEFLYKAAAVHFHGHGWEDCENAASRDQMLDDAIDRAIVEAHNARAERMQAEYSPVEPNLSEVCPACGNMRRAGGKCGYCGDVAQQCAECQVYPHTCDGQYTPCPGFMPDESARLIRDHERNIKITGERVKI